MIKKQALTYQILLSIKNKLLKGGDVFMRFNLKSGKLDYLRPKFET